MKSKKLCGILSVGMLSALLLSGCAYIPQNAKLIEINGGEDSISLGYGNFMARYMQAMYDQVYGSYYGSDMWDEDMSDSGQTLEEDVKDGVIETIEAEYVLVAHATDYGISLTDDEISQIEAAADEFLDSNSEEAIKQVGASREYLITYLTNQEIASRMQDAIYEEADVTVTEEEAEEADSDVDTLTEERQSEYYDKVVEEWKDEYTWELNDRYWSFVEFTDVFTSVSSSES